MDADALVAHRYSKFRNMGRYDLLSPEEQEAAVRRARGSRETAPSSRETGCDTVQAAQLPGRAHDQRGVLGLQGACPGRALHVNGPEPFAPFDPN